MLLVASLLAGAGGMCPPAGSAAAGRRPAPARLEKPLHIVADEVVIDNSGAMLLARGHVQLTYGARRATADQLRLNRAARTAELSGHAIVTDPQGRATGDTVTLYLAPDEQVRSVVMVGAAGVETREYALSGDRITADQQSGRLLAEGHVRAFSAPDLLVTGDRATYDRRTQHGTVAGHPVVSNKAGRVRGDRIELFQAAGRAVVHGPVDAEIYGATMRSASAVVDFRTSTAVLTGQVVITRRQGTLRADRVTIFYKTRRILATGATHVRLTDTAEDAAP